MAFQKRFAQIRSAVGKAIVGQENYRSHVLNAADSIAQGRTTDEDLGYRRLSMSGDKNLNPVAHDRLLRLMQWLYYANPVMRRLAEIPVDYAFDTRLLAAPGAHPKLQGVLDRFWKHPYNNLPMEWQNFVERLLLEGELLLPITVLPYTGEVLISFAEPQDIKEIRGLESDPRKIMSIKMRGERLDDGKEYDVVNYQIVPRTVKLTSQREVEVMGFRWGQAFYFRLSHLVTGRGRPPYEPSIDMIGVHDDVLFDQGRNVAFQGAFNYDVEMPGAQPVEVEKRRAEIQAEGPPRSGSVRVHNDREKWTVLSPALDTTIASELPEQLRKVIGLGGGVAETWLNASSDVNRASAAAADTPPLRHLQRVQHTIGEMARFMGDTAIDAAILTGQLPRSLVEKPELREFNVDMADLTTADNKATAVALKSLSESLHVAIMDEVTDIGTARTLFYRIAGVELPLDLDERIAARPPKKEEPSDEGSDTDADPSPVDAL